MIPKENKPTHHSPMRRDRVHPVCTHDGVEVIYGVCIPFATRVHLVKIRVEVEYQDSPRSVDDGQLGGLGRGPRDMHNRAPRKVRRDDTACRLTETPCCVLGMSADIAQV